MNVHNPMDLKKGTRFQHKSWMDPVAKEPLTCRVTCIRYGAVYWRQEEIQPSGAVRLVGGSWRFPIDRAEVYVAAVLP